MCTPLCKDGRASAKGKTQQQQDLRGAEVTLVSPITIIFQRANGVLLMSSSMAMP